VKTYEVSVSKPIKLEKTEAQKSQAAQIDATDLINNAVAAPFSSDNYLQ